MLFGTLLLGKFYVFAQPFSSEPVGLFAFRIYDNEFREDIDRYKSYGFISFLSDNPAIVIRENDYIQDITNPNRYRPNAGEHVDGIFYGYILNRDTRIPDSFVQISTDTWEVVSSSPVSQMPNDMAYDYTTGVMYGIVNNTHLVTINMTTGAMTQIGSLGRSACTLACDRLGKLFAIDSQGSLCSVNKTSGVATTIGSTGYFPVALQTMAFDQNTGRLFWAMYNAYGDGKLIEILPNSGIAIDKGVIGRNAELVGLYSIKADRPTIGFDQEGSQEAADCYADDVAVNAYFYFPVVVANALSDVSIDLTIVKKDFNGKETSLSPYTKTDVPVSSSGVFRLNFIDFTGTGDEEVYGVYELTITKIYYSKYDIEGEVISGQDVFTYSIRPQPKSNPLNQITAVAQDGKICMGTKAVYAAEGLKDSKFIYKLEESAGKIIKEYTDSIIVEWGYTKGVYQLGVQEISQYGCEGEWAFLNVEVVGDYAQFTQPEFVICGNDGVTVTFNQSNFNDWEWMDKTVGKDGKITKSGVYDLKTTDKNNCTLISSIKVVACDEPPETIKVFNTFTPNDDGVNDEWNIEGLRYYPNSIVEVFDRWGRKVFTSTRGYTVPWNGRDARGRHLPMETYYYIIHLNDGITKEPIRGNINIIR